MGHKVGGVPCGFYLFKRFLPEDKTSRHHAITIITLLVTYATCVVFVTTRIPVIMIEAKVMQECVPSMMNLTEINKWCKNFEFLGNTQLVMACLATVAQVAYAVSLHISGCIADYFNPRYYLTIGCLSGSFFCISFSLTTVWDVQSLEFMIAIIILQQMVYSTVWPITLSCCTYWYSGSRIGLVFGLWNTHLATGRIVGIALVFNTLIENWGSTFIVPGSLLAVISVFVFAFLVAHPTDLNKLYQTNKDCTEDDTACPSWLDSWAALDYLDAFRVPGVLEFSGCMFFARIADLSCLFWLPQIEHDSQSGVFHDSSFIDPMTLANLPFVFGAIVGGVASGILKDVYNKSALICIVFYMTSLPITALHMFEAKMHRILRIVLNSLLGVCVHGPYILLLASISYDLSRDPLIRRGHRGIATVAAIIESAGAAGAGLTSLVNYLIATNNVTTTSVFQIIMLVEMAAGLTLVRMAWRETNKKEYRVSIKKYFLDPRWKKRQSSI